MNLVGSEIMFYQNGDIYLWSEEMTVVASLEDIIYRVIHFCSQEITS